MATTCFPIRRQPQLLFPTAAAPASSFVHPYPNTTMNPKRLQGIILGIKKNILESIYSLFLQNFTISHHCTILYNRPAARPRQGDTCHESFVFSVGYGPAGLPWLLRQSLGKNAQHRPPGKLWPAI
jgi:hypothetical protein